MTRNLTISDTMCGECLTSYDSVEEATECEELDIADRRDEEEANEYWAEYAAAEEQNHWESDPLYIEQNFPAN